MDLAIELLDVTKRFVLDGRSIDVLRGVDLVVERGSFVALMGPSGSGKSTLLSIIGGLDVPTAGRVCVDGQRLEALDERRLSAFRSQSVGFVFQTHNLLPALSAVENVLLPLEFGRQNWSRKAAQSRARDLLRAVGLAERAESPANCLSGGEQQRVAIARALANDPPLLVADEPTGDLDTANGAMILELLTGLRADDRTIFLVTHDVHVASLADETLHLIDGRLVDEVSDGDP